MPNVKALASQFHAKSNALMDGDRRIQAGFAKTAASSKRLPIEALDRAGLKDTKNPLLQDIYGLTRKYNVAWRPVELEHNLEIRSRRISRLDNILYLISQYYTEKRVNDGSTRPARWAALTLLWKAILSELDLLGALPLTTPSDFRQVTDNFATQSYWLERIDTMNRPGFELSAAFETWLKQTQANTGSRFRKDSFWEWVRLGNSRDITNRLTVKYDDGEGQVLYDNHVHFDDQNKVRDCKDQAFSTQTHRTHASGNGWAIWVCSTPMVQRVGVQLAHRVFTGSHTLGKFHHSSFLGGAAVTAAGEWVVENGVIKVITAKSGHYKPRTQDMFRFVGLFREIPGDALIRPNLLDRTEADKKIKFYRVADFRAMGTGATPVKKADFTAKMPDWANKSMTENGDLMANQLPT